MAREEVEREDLLRDATALVERVEIQTTGDSGALVIGFRENGCLSFYFGEESAYHFNSAGHLRRAYADRLLYKADRDRLVALEKKRTAGEVHMLRHDLDQVASEEFLAQLRSRLVDVRDALEQGDFERVAQVPSDASVVERVKNWLSQLPPTITVAHSPHAR